MVGVEHRLAGAVALDLHNSEVGLRRAAFQAEGLLELLQIRFGLFKGLQIFFRIDTGNHLVSLDFKLCFFKRIFGLLEFRHVLGAGRVPLSLLSGNLVHQVAEFGLLVQEILDLALAVEFYKKVPRLHFSPGRRQLGYHERAELRPGQHRRQHGPRLHRFGRPAQPEGVDEFAALNSYGVYDFAGWDFRTACASGHRDPNHQREGRQSSQKRHEQTTARPGRFSRWNRGRLERRPSTGRSARNLRLHPMEDRFRHVSQLAAPQSDRRGRQEETGAPEATRASRFRLPSRTQPPPETSPVLVEKDGTGKPLMNGHPPSPIHAP